MKVRPTRQTSSGNDAAIPAVPYECLRRTINAVTHDVTPDLRALMVAKYLEEAVQHAGRRLVARPTWLRTILRNSGDALVLRLLKENWEHTGNSAAVQDQFGIPPSTLHREKDEGRVIAYRPAGAKSFLFPLEQFVHNGCANWAEEVVRAVGNGAPALHFLYAKRASLSGKSYADALRHGGTRRVNAIGMLRETARRSAALD